MCFTLEWIRELIVWIIVICAIVAILRLLLPMIAARLGATLVGVINIVLWAVIAIAIVYLCFALLSCLSGGGLPLFPVRH